ncbi:copper chaperone PCu(A)C [Shewanella marinintestina]|uniref:copper chaperone PCu(A)C n=1 Tax=Shewanella marinintestina TaxID=190305 RepID=UPI00200FE222|nr:copper chaperone PCu(A)C [Shewanella marinintestina]MCL1148221.1 copper chaperone PCu(A)C [Shewanella marinintestina]
MEFMTLKLIFKQLFNIGLLSCLSFTTMAQVVLVDGYVRAMPATVPNSAAYITIENHGDATRLVAVDAPFATEAQLHTLIEENGMIKMRQVEGFDIDSHGSLVLSESGNHIMLMGLKQPLVIDSNVKLLLKFANGSEQEISLPVKKQVEQSDDAHHHHHH